MANETAKEIKKLTEVADSLRASAHAYNANVAKLEKSIDKNRIEAEKSGDDYNETTDQFKKYGLILKESVKVAKAEQAEKKLGKLKNLEEKREKKDGAKGKGAKFELKKEVKEPSFLQKIGKLAFGIIGAAAFVMVVKNFDAIKKFFIEKLVPAAKSFLTFMKDTALPFIIDNFENIVKGIVAISAVIIGAKVLIRIYNAVSALTTVLSGVGAGIMKTLRFLRIGKALNALGLAFRIFRVFMLKTFIPMVVNALRSAASAVGGGLMKGLQFLIKAFQVFRLFMVTTLIPTIVGAFATAAASLVPVMIALAPFILIGLAIAALIGGIVFLLTKVRDALGFESVFDVLMLGILHLKDAFGHVVNFVGSIVNFILGIIEKFAKYIPGFEDIELPRIPEMATDSAEKFKIQKQEEAKANAAAEAEAKPEQKPEQKPRSEMNRYERLQDNQRRERERLEGKQTVEQKEPDDISETKPQETSKTRGNRYEQIQARMARDREATQRAEDRKQQGGGGGMIAVNAPTSTTTNNSTAMYGEPTPATDDLDRVYGGGMFSFR